MNIYNVTNLNEWEWGNFKPLYASQSTPKSENRVYVIYKKNKSDNNSLGIFQKKQQSRDMLFEK